MKIERHLPQFKDEAALLIVCGSHVSKIYIAKDGEISEAAIVETPIPHYSDREGLFGNSGKGKLFARGGPLEFPKQWVLTDFLKKMEHTLKVEFPGRTIQGVYLFSPSHMRNLVFEALPAHLKELPVIEFEGNHVKRHPFTLLAEIRKLDQQKVSGNGNEVKKHTRLHER